MAPAPELERLGPVAPFFRIVFPTFTVLLPRPMLAPKVLLPEELSLKVQLVTVSVEALPALETPPPKLPVVLPLKVQLVTGAVLPLILPMPPPCWPVALLRLKV